MTRNRVAESGSRSGRDGQVAEHAARRYLERRGLVPVEANYRCRFGEVDLIMRDGAELVFVEVRYRRGRGFGGALESVGRTKQSRVRTAAAHYLQRQTAEPTCRFDVVALSGPLARPTVDWIRDAW